MNKEIVSCKPRVPRRAPLAVCVVEQWGIRLRRDSWVSVMYAEGLNSAKSSVTLRSTDRHEILGQKPTHLQVSL